MPSQGPSSLIDLTIGSFMNKRTKIIEVSRSLRDSIHLMKENDIGSIIVVENEKPAGIFTERDLVKIADRGSTVLDAKMKDVMSHPLTTISSTATLWDAISLMGRKDIRRLPVVEKDRLVGIVTEKDILRVILSQQNLLLESVSEYLPALTREQLRELVEKFGVEKPPSRM